MYIFTCENTFEDMMCCIYHAWEKALKVGHGCVRPVSYAHLTLPTNSRV